MPHKPATLIGIAAYLVVGAAALWRGGPAERRVGLVILVQVFVTPFVADRRHIDAIQYGLLAVDFTVLAAILFVALTSQRRWVLWAVGFQVDAIATHLAHVVDPSIGSWSLLSSAIYWGYAVVASLAYGTLQTVLRGTSRAKLLRRAA